MKLKKKIINFILAICLVLPAMFALTACGGQTPTPTPTPSNDTPSTPAAIREKGRTYAFANDSLFDIAFNWASADEKATFTPYLSTKTERNYLSDYKVTKVVFNQQGKVTLDIYGETAATAYYTIGENNKLSFYDDKDCTTPANPMLNTSYGYDYQFDNTRETITITLPLDWAGCEFSTIKIILTAGAEYLDSNAEYFTSGDDVTIDWNESDLAVLMEEYGYDNRGAVENEYISDEFLADGYFIMSPWTTTNYIISNFGHYEISENGTMTFYNNDTNFAHRLPRRDIVNCVINAERTQITLTMRVLRPGFTSTITAVYNLQVGA